ncbi:MAG TPA: hypothetical protein VFV75_07805 [Candidatus Polarisedimenticolaceae bacterium]|nr:hypothetical protein [Candidatus Polarisedimenticolaceae bacterium]
MIGFLRAFVWLRWRLLVGSLRGSARRDALERLSRVLAALVPLLLLLGVVVAGLGLGGAALGAGWAVGSHGIDPLPVLLAVRGVLLVVLVIVVLGALTGPAQGGLTGSTRLRTLPVSDRRLHHVEALTALIDPWVLYVVPALLLLPLGLLLGGNGGAALVALLAGMAFLLVLVCLASAAAQLARWFLRNRRRAETFTVLFVLGLSALSLLPALIGDRVERELRRAEGAGRPPRIARSLPRGTPVLPSELYARALRQGLRHGPAGGWLPMGSLVLEAAVLYAVSAGAHRRVLTTVESGAPRGAAGTAAAAARRLPLLSPASSAVALAQLRTALRTVRGRLVVLTPAPLVLVFGVLSRKIPDELPGGGAWADGPLLLGAGAIFGLYALQAFTMNQFASDRAGLTLQFLLPLSEWALVVGKAVGCGLVYGATLVLALICAAGISPGGSALDWAAVLLGSGATYVLLAPVAALLSAWLPVASDLGRTGTGGNPHGLAMAAGTLLVLLAAGPPGAILLVVHRALDRPLLGLALMAGWTALAVVLAVPLLRLAARAIGPRRENLALVAGSR